MLVLHNYRISYCPILLKMLGEWFYIQTNKPYRFVNLEKRTESQKVANQDWRWMKKIFHIRANLETSFEKPINKCKSKGKLHHRWRALLLLSRNLWNFLHNPYCCMYWGKRTYEFERSSWLCASYLITCQYLYLRLVNSGNISKHYALNYIHNRNINFTIYYALWDKRLINRTKTE